MSTREEVQAEDIRLEKCEELEEVGTSTKMPLSSIVHQTQSVKSALSNNHKVLLVSVDHPALNNAPITKKCIRETAYLGEEPPLGAETSFQVGDIVQAKIQGYAGIWTGMVMAPLSTVFKEADQDGHIQITYQEWKQRLNLLVEVEVLGRLFDECDKDKKGALSLEEFTVGLEGKYEIKWAQDPQKDCIKDVKELRMAPDADLFRKEVAAQKVQKDQLQKDQEEFQKMILRQRRDIEGRVDKQAKAFFFVIVYGLCLAVTIMVLSQTLEWKKDDSECDDTDSDKVCTCKDTVPVYMLVTGILQMPFWVIVGLRAITTNRQTQSHRVEQTGLTFHQIAEIEKEIEKERKETGLTFIDCSLYCSAIPLLVINIMMWVSMFESDQKCGANMRAVGIGLLVIGLVSSCQAVFTASGKAICTTHWR